MGGSLLAALLVLVGTAAQAQQPAAAAAAAEARLALVIGNSGYPDAPLANPVNDARDMADALSALGFQVVVKENANRLAMRQAIRDFGNALRERRGVGLFFFAGHGMQVKGRNFLIPVGEDIQAEDEVEDQAVSIDLVLEKMETAGNRINVVVLDACRNNPFQRRFRSGSRGLAPIDAARGSFIAFATAPGAVAADGSGRNGVFTKHLLESLRHPESAIESVFKRTRVGVLEETANRQIPWESSSLTGDFRFNPLQPGDAAGVAPPAAALVRLAPVERSPGTARIVFFRQPGFIGSALNYRIEHNGKPVGNLGNGAHFSYESPPGEQNFSPVGNFGSGSSFSLEPGKTYYIELSVVPFSASFKQVGKDTAEAAVRSLR